jgi:serine/threonine protein kinase
VHPHVVALHGVCDQAIGEQRALHLVMECGGGGGLDSQIKPGCRLHSSSAVYPLGGKKRTAEVARIGYQAALGLLHSHSRGYSHCDVKLANLVLHDNGHVLVTDFGLAFRVRQGGRPLAPAGTLPGQREQLGSFKYMCPENFEVCAHTGQPPCDVYALAFVLLELAQGEEVPSPTLLEVVSVLPPPGSAELAALGIPCMGTGYRPPLPEALDERLRALIVACWAADPRARPTMAAVASTLLKMQRDPPPVLNISFISSQAGEDTVLLDFIPSEKIKGIKARIQAMERVPFVQQRLIFAGKQLEDELSVDYYNIQPNCSLFMVLRRLPSYFWCNSITSGSASWQPDNLPRTIPFEEGLQLTIFLSDPGNHQDCYVWSPEEIESRAGPLVSVKSHDVEVPRNLYREHYNRELHAVVLTPLLPPWLWSFLGASAAMGSGSASIFVSPLIITDTEKGVQGALCFEFGAGLVVSPAQAEAPAQAEGGGGGSSSN